MFYYTAYGGTSLNKSATQKPDFRDYKVIRQLKDLIKLFLKISSPLVQIVFSETHLSCKLMCVRIIWESKKKSICRLKQYKSCQFYRK